MFCLTSLPSPHRLLTDFSAVQVDCNSSAISYQLLKPSAQTLTCNLHVLKGEVCVTHSDKAWTAAARAWDEADTWHAHMHSDRFLCNKTMHVRYRACK